MGEEKLDVVQETKDEFKGNIRGAFCLIFLLGGINHFTNTDLVIKMMPPQFPVSTHQPLVYLVGIVELLLCVGILIPKFQKICSIGVMAFLAATMWPLVYTAYNSQSILPEFPFMAVWAAVPVQLAMLGGAWWISGIHSPMWFLNNLISEDNRDPDRPPEDEIEERKAG